MLLALMLLSFTCWGVPQPFALGRDHSLYRAGASALLASAPCAVPKFDFAVDLAVGLNPISVVVGDFNGDKKPDLAVANQGSNRVSLLLGDGLGRFPIRNDFLAGFSPQSVAAGDFNRDGRFEFAVANFSSNDVSLVSIDQLGFLTAARNFTTGLLPQAVASGDFNGDGRLDLVIANSASSNVTILLGDGRGGFFSTRSFLVGMGPISVVVADFNRDHKLDLAVANNATDNVTILLGDGLGGFTAARDFLVGAFPEAIATGDFNRDGFLDLAVAGSGLNKVTTLLGDGQGFFTVDRRISVGGSPRSVAVGDFNRDGLLDLAVANQGSNSVSVLLGDGLGGFPVRSDFTVGGSPQSVAVGDFNRDGRPDLAVANHFSNSVTILFNTCPAPALINVSAASFDGDNLAPEAITTAFGNSLATTIQQAQTTPLPVTLGGTTVEVTDGTGSARLAPLFFVSPTQVNYQVPLGTALGLATVKITSADGAVSVGTTEITAVAPGLFTANSDGSGVAAGLVQRVRPGAPDRFESIAQFDPIQMRVVPVPIDLGPSSDQVFLILYGTGFRFRSSLAAVTATIGGVEAQVSYAGPAPGFIGLDQVNVLIPRSLIGRGDVDVTLTADGRTANAVQVNIK